MRARIHDAVPVRRTITQEPALHPSLHRIAASTDPTLLVIEDLWMASSLLPPSADPGVTRPDHQALAHCHRVHNLVRGNRIYHHAVRQWPSRGDELLRVAFYFDENVAYANSLTQVDLAMTSSIANAIPEQRRHVTILPGTLPQYEFARNKASLTHVVDSLLGKTIPAWTTIQAAELKQMLSKIDVVAFVINGLVPPDSREIHRLLTGTVGYLGAIEALPSEEICWALYDNSLPARYRIIGNELRVFYREAEYVAGADRDEMSMTAFKEANIYRRVAW